MLKLRSIGIRFAALSLFSVVLTTLGILGILKLQQQSLMQRIREIVVQRADSETARVAHDTRLLCETMHAALQGQIGSNLQTAKYLLEQAGGARLSSKETATWTAVDQITKVGQQVTLPKMTVGEQWLGQNSDPKVATPVLDRAQSLASGTITLFQRMNERGDMLRVATTVLDDKGRRAIGTFIAARGETGEANPVVASVLAGQRYLGRAFVVNAWYITGYEPLYDARHEVIGMLYVGVEQDSLLKPVERALTSEVVGKTGYVWAMGGTGGQKGVFAFGERSMTQGLQTRDAAGKLLFEELIAKAKAVAGAQGESAISHHRFSWSDAANVAAEERVAAVTYFAPWDWVIGVTVPQADYSMTADSVRSAVADIERWSMLVALGAFVVLGLTVFFATQRMTRPLKDLVKAAEAVSTGDLRQTIEVRSDDEIGQLAKAFSTMVTSMREIATGLHDSVSRMNQVVESLNTSQAEQNQAMSRQAAALQETQVTAQEIKQTSLMAAQKAEAVLQVTSRADEFSRSGESAVEQSLAGLMEIRSQAESIASKIQDLGGRTRQIGKITNSVKDLADQSNMLALNAAIEAVRSGEHGKGFAVVAREVRSLADQSISSTEKVREILDDITASIDVAVAISKQGVQRMEGGLSQVKTSGDNLRELSEIVRENAAAVRQIAAAVSQQNAGVSQIFAAVTELTSMMDDTIKRIEANAEMVRTLMGVSAQVSTFANTYRV
ncbi:MAG: methyl-accepting chemotaxis protein [Myxococcales bacterium]